MRRRDVRRCSISAKLRELPVVEFGPVAEERSLRGRRREAARIYVQGMEDVLHDAFREVMRLNVYRAPMGRKRSEERVAKRARRAGGSGSRLFVWVNAWKLPQAKVEAEVELLCTLISRVVVLNVRAADEARVVYRL